MYYPYKLLIHIRQGKGMYKWIAENISGNYWPHDGQSDVVWFELEEDAVAFKLRWI